MFRSIPPRERRIGRTRLPPFPFPTLYMQVGVAVRTREKILNRARQRVLPKIAQGRSRSIARSGFVVGAALRGRPSHGLQFGQHARKQSDSHRRVRSPAGRGAARIFSHLLMSWLLFASGVLAQEKKQPEKAEPQKAASEQKETAKPGEEKKEPQKIGNETCLACHDAVQPIFSRTSHASNECESCHGPGSEHAEAGGGLTLSFKSKPAKWANTQCLACHKQKGDISGFSRSPHGRNSVSCVSCHRVHPESPNFGLLKADPRDVCGSCHQGIRAQFRKPFHHPVLEGAMKCDDCHNPHLEERRPLRRQAVGSEPGCVSCHSDKNGPFVFEHAAVKINGCESCHQPHGSVNPKMLVRNEVHQLCLECHSLTRGVAGRQPPAFHDLRTARFRNCTTCHREIHGSNASPVFLR